MLNFSVENPVLQDLLEWVAQPPSMLASDPFDPDSPKVLEPRDTHAIRFDLVDHIPHISPGGAPMPRPIYSGFLFFRPGKPNTISGQDQPALMGIGNFMLAPYNCQILLGMEIDGVHVQLPKPDHSFVQVNLRFRPPKIFGQLTFQGTPGFATRSVELSKIDVLENGEMILWAEPRVSWSLSTLMKSTLLSPIARPNFQTF